MDNLEGTRQDIADGYRVSLGMVKKAFPALQQRRGTGGIGARHAYSGRIFFFSRCVTNCLRGS